MSHAVVTTSPPTEPEPPHPPKRADLLRWQFTRKARRILYNKHDADAAQRINQRARKIRQEAWGIADMSGNQFRRNWNELAKLYVRTPIVSNPDEVATGRMAKLLDESILWQLMKRVQRDTLALQEMLLRVDVVDRDLVFTPTFPDLAVAEPVPSIPYEPQRLELPVLRARDNGDMIWTWEIIDKSTGEWSVVSKDRKKNLNAEFLKDKPTRYQWHKTDVDGVLGVNVLPFTLYHAQTTGRLWDPWDPREQVEGTLELIVSETFRDHQEFKTSFGQRWSLDAHLKQAPAVLDENQDLVSRQEVVSDPAVVQQFASDDTGLGQAQLGTFEAPSNLKELQEVIALKREAIFALTGAKAKRTADPRSGFAISLDRDDQRAAQNAWRKEFERGDANTVTLAAIVLNRDAQARNDGEWVPFPESGWTVHHQGIPQSKEERKAQEEHLAAQIEAGLMSKTAALIELHPDLTKEEAFARLVAIEVEKVRLAEAILAAVGTTTSREDDNG